MICPLVRLEATLEHKFNALKKHVDIANSLRHEIKILESEKLFVSYHIKNEKNNEVEINCPGIVANF